MTNKYYGKQKSERYPPGSPLGGRFKPKNTNAVLSRSVQARATAPVQVKSGPQRNPRKSTLTLPPSIIPLISLTDLDRSLPGGLAGKFKRRLWRNNLHNDLHGSLIGIHADRAGTIVIDRDVQQWQKENGLGIKESNEIAKIVAEHASTLLKTQERSRPEFVQRMKAYTPTFSDFGGYPLEAVVDHDSKVILLNRDMFASRSPRRKDMSALLSAITHEYAHVVDHSITDTPDTAAFTENFKPLHDYLSKQDKYNGKTPKWMIDSGLAYPLNGYFGMAGKGDMFMQLSKEYVSTLSELYWHSPKYLTKLDDKLTSDGYSGPKLKEIMTRVWGNVSVDTPAAGQKERIKDIDNTPLDIENDLGVRGTTYKNRWQPGKSSSHPEKYLLSATGGG